MGPGIFLIAILGCGEAEAPCETVQMLPARYESEAACVAATEEALLRNSDADYPVVVAQCVADGKAPPRLTPAEVERPGAPDLDPRSLPASPVRS